MRATAAAAAGGWRGTVPGKMLAAVLLAAGATGQTPCERYTDFTYGPSVRCGNGDLPAVPTGAQWGGFPASEITGGLTLVNEDIAEVPDGGFDACPYTAATALALNYNEITAVGRRAFARLAELTVLRLNNNRITSMTAEALAGLTRLERLYLQQNRIGAFDYGSLAPMPALGVLWLDNQQGGDLSCEGADRWGLPSSSPDAAGIRAAIASCGATGSPCSCDAVACPADDPEPNAGVVCDPDTETAPEPEPEPNDSDGNLSPGAVVGIAAGSAVAVAAAGYVAYKRVKNSKADADAGAVADPLLSGGFL